MPGMLTMIEIILIIAMFVMCCFPIALVIQVRKDTKLKRMFDHVKSENDKKVNELSSLFTEVMIEYHKFILEVLIVSRPKTLNLLVVHMGTKANLLNYYMSITYLKTRYSKRNTKIFNQYEIELMKLLYYIIYNISITYFDINYKPSHEIKHSYKLTNPNDPNRYLIDIQDKFDFLSEVYKLSDECAYTHGIALSDRSNMVDSLNRLSSMLNNENSEICECIRLDENQLRTSITEAITALDPSLAHEIFKNTKKMSFL